MLDYLQHWGRSVPVFTSAPEPAALKLSIAQTLVANRLVTTMKQANGVMAISGTIGSGKSTIVRWLYEQFDQESWDILLVTPAREFSTSDWLWPRLAGFLGLTQFSTDAALNRLQQLQSVKRHLIIAIDNCERLKSPTAYVEILGLCDAAQIAGTSLRILLSGNAQYFQTSEQTNLESKEAWEIWSKIQWHAQLTDANQDDVKHVIHARLEEANLPSKTFNGEAIDGISRLANGNLHVAVNLCENCLIEAAIKEKKIINFELVQAAAKGLLIAHTKRAAVTRPTPVETKKKNIKEPDVPLKSLFKNKK